MLTIRRPTPTTVLYTVSTRSLNRTLAAQAQRVAVAIGRIVVGFSVLFILLSKAQSSNLINFKDVVVLSETSLFGNAARHLSRWIALNTTWPWVFPLSIATLWLVFRKNYTEESLLVIRGLGVQTSTSSPTYLSTSATRFIPTNMIQDILIHEAFKGFEVKFYLAIVVEGEEDVVVVFPVSLLYAIGIDFVCLFAFQSILPKRQILEEVWRGARACLYEPKT